MNNELTHKKKSRVKNKDSSLEIINYTVNESIGKYWSIVNE